MPADLRVTVDEKVLEIDVSQVLEDLTGEETLAVEDFLGGWENFDSTGESARSVYLLYYLARRGTGEKITLKDVLQEKGVMFGDRVKLDDLDENGNVVELDEEGKPKVPPAEAADEAATPSTPSAPSVVSGAGT